MIQYAAPEVPAFTQQQALQPSGTRYPDRAVKETWFKGCLEVGNRIRIKEVIQKDDFELAVLCTIQRDADWIDSKLLARTKIIWVLHTERAGGEERTAKRVSVGYCFSMEKDASGCCPKELSVLLSVPWRKCQWYMVTLPISPLLGYFKAS